MKAFHACRWWVCALLLTAFSSSAEEVRLLVSIGSNLGFPEDSPLLYAEDDAKKVRDALVEIGAVQASRAYLLKRPTASTVRATLQEVTGRVAELHSQGHGVQLMVYLSSHGKNGAARLGRTPLEFDELRKLATETGADLRLLVVDACESGVRRKGSVRGPAYALELSRPTARGDIFIASSGFEEYAQEWGTLEGSLFTHHLLSGLRGDADFNSDGRVTLMEAYGYAERRTVAQSVDLGQHPEFDVDVLGASDVVLTELSRGAGKIIFDEGLEGRFLVMSQPRAEVVLEINKQKNRQVQLAVPAGRYLIRHPRGFRVALQAIDMPYGGSVRISQNNFVLRDYSEVSLKSGAVELRPQALKVSYVHQSPPLANTAWRQIAHVDWRYASGHFWLNAGVGYGTTRYRGQGLEIRERDGRLRLSGGYRFWVGPVSLIPALQMDVSILRQSFRRDDEDNIARIYGPLPMHWVWGAAIMPQFNAEVPVIGALFLAASGSTGMRYLPAESQPSWQASFEGEIGMGLRF